MGRVLRKGRAADAWENVKGIRRIYDVERTIGSCFHSAVQIGKISW